MACLVSSHCLQTASPGEEAEEVDVVKAAAEQELVPWHRSALLLLLGCVGGTTCLLPTLCSRRCLYATHSCRQLLHDLEQQLHLLGIVSAEAPPELLQVAP
jgi:hypothetical protein